MTDPSTFTPTPNSTFRLDNLAWDEISGVDMPAHLTPGWMVMKSAGGTSGATPVNDTKEGQVPDDDIQINKAALAPEIAAYIESLEAQVAEAVAKAEEAPAPAENEDTLAKALDAVPEEIRKHLDDMNARVEMAEATARAEQDLRLTGDFIAKAAEYENLPTVDPESFGPILRKAAEALGEDAPALFDVLAAADAAIGEGELFKSAGLATDHGASASDAYGKLQVIAKSAMETDPNLTEAQAIAKAAESNPDLYSDYLAETGA